MGFPAQLLNSCCPSSSETRFALNLPSQWFTVKLTEETMMLRESLSESFHWLSLRKATSTVVQFNCQCDLLSHKLGLGVIKSLQLDEGVHFAVLWWSVCQGKRPVQAWMARKQKYIQKCLCFVPQTTSYRNYFHVCFWSFWENCSASETSTWGNTATTAALGQSLQQDARKEIEGSNFHFAGFAPIKSSI